MYVCMYFFFLDSSCCFHNGIDPVGERYLFTSMSAVILNGGAGRC